MASKNNDHIHKYERREIGGTRVVKIDGKKHLEKVGNYIVYKCAIPGCTHYIARELAIGRQSICWGCEQELILDAENTTLKKPRHKQCRRKRVVLLDHTA